MTPQRLSVLIAFFPYAGNSSGSSMAWDVTAWLAKTISAVKKDDRISDINIQSFCNTPITMTRNQAVKAAQELGVDVLVMVDSDMKPDMYEDSPPFFDTAFTEIYNHYQEGPLVIAAPYGGAPPHENMFVFHWRGFMNAGDETPFSLEQYTREEAIKMRGIQEAAALPTGVIMYDMRAFDLIEHPYFKYEWTDETESQKASTEDVQNTRDISLAGQAKLGYNPVRCAWDCWAGHLKVWTVGRPQLLTTESVSDQLRRAVERGPIDEQEVFFESTAIPSGSGSARVSPLRSTEGTPSRPFRPGPEGGLRLPSGMQIMPERDSSGGECSANGGGAVKCVRRPDPEIDTGNCSSEPRSE